MIKNRKQSNPTAKDKDSSMMKRHRSITVSPVNRRRVATTRTPVIIKKESNTAHPTTKLVKPEPGIFMIHQSSKKNVRWHYVHASGKCCLKGDHSSCHKTDEYEEDELPELVPVSKSP